MTAALQRARTYWRLGVPNLLRVAAYRIGLRSGLHPVQRARAVSSTGPYFGIPILAKVDAPDARGWTDAASLFSFHPVPLGDGPPDWLADPLSGTRIAADRQWWQIPDFGGVDIKTVWEFSRFDWALVFAQRARNGDAASLARLNDWIADWATQNPPFLGPNWKCGQEASLRVLHLAAAAIVLGSEKSALPGLLDLVETHLARIAPSVSYATAQDNNHATSEAAALFIGGSWLAHHQRAVGAGYASQGRRELERHVARLFEADGTFSQYSVNYHRLALDTLSLAELWRRRFALPPFSGRLLGRMQAATAWLRAMTDPAGGDAPVLGANDGARLLQLTPTPYRDHRPSVQLASALFDGRRAFADPQADHALLWMGIDPPAAIAAPQASVIFPDGGYAVLIEGDWRAVLRFPRNKFRPGQADALHLDLWHGSTNLLRDGGSFSYNDPDGQGLALTSTRAHNTVEFDGTDQMPRIGRFLHADWIDCEIAAPLKQSGCVTSFAASYRNKLGHRHTRTIEIAADRVRVFDEIDYFIQSAILRWRLSPSGWKVSGNLCASTDAEITVSSDRGWARIALVPGHESRHYLQLADVPVLEAEAHHAPARLTTEIRRHP